MQRFRYTQGFKGRSVPLSIRIGSAVRAFFLVFTVVVDFPSIRGVRLSISPYSVTFLNDITNLSHGKLLDFFGVLFRLVRIKDRIIFDGDSKRKRALASYNGKVVNVSIDKFSEVGFCKIEEFLEQTSAASLLHQIQNLPGSTDLSDRIYSTQKDWTLDLLSGPRFHTDRRALEVLPAVQSICDSELVLRIARDYLGCAPMLASVQSWTIRPLISATHDLLDSSAMAFHCDSDYFSFIKFFIMLNNVDMNNGPFTFVAYSHRGKRHVAGRMEDDEIVGPKDEVLYGTANAGDMVVCDTKGWHKAKPPVTGSRTVLQLVFASNLFGRTS
jgi:ectoine hydroxylase-related dioxygenase (phytanoyl-CoA dioxygenase family)